MPIQFDVIDVNCEAANQSFFVPQINITTKSTSTFATILGYSEFVPSSPPKKYRKATISGVSERIGYTLEQTPNQCAGAQYIFSGTGEYDLKGNLISKYSKKFFAQCGKQFWPAVPLQLNPHPVIKAPCPNTTFCSFVGYCWPADPQSCAVCDPNIVNWPFISEQATNEIVIDLQGFSTTAPVLTSTTYTVSGQVFGVCEIASPNFTFVNSGNFYPISVGSTVIQVQSVFVNPTLAFPIVNFNGFIGAYINFVDASNFSCTLSEEYTDTDAMNNATTVVGTGNTAATTPRTTGFTSIFTSVVFTLNISNLVAGFNYTATVDFWEKGPGVNTHTPKTYNFTATSGTYTIVDTVPTPANGHTITVQKPTIAFSN